MNEQRYRKDLTALCAKVRSFLDETGGSQRNLAERAGLAQTKLSRLLSGTLTRLSEEECERLEACCRRELKKAVQPTMHPHFEIGSRVCFSLAGRMITGEVGGIAHQAVAFTYIVLLDEPLQVPGYDRPWRAVSIWGTELAHAHA